MLGRRTGYLRIVSQLGDIGLGVRMNCIQLILGERHPTDPGTVAETNTKT